MNANTDSSRTLRLLPGALLPQRWLAGNLLQGQLPAISEAIARGSLRMRDATLLPAPSSLPASSVVDGVEAEPVDAAGCSLRADEDAVSGDWAHDRWLRQQNPLSKLALPAGALSPIRRLASLPGAATLQRPGWLLQPVAFRLTTDRMLLDPEGSQRIDAALARRLTQAIAPLLADSGYDISMLTPDVWLLQQRPALPGWRLFCHPVEAVGEQHVDAFMPRGPDARMFRRLFNEIQMLWYQLNQDDPEDLPVNGVWLSGPLTPESLAAYQAVLDRGVIVDESLLPARLAFDLNGWLQALSALDAHYVQAPDQFACLLCGQHEARWLLAPGARQTPLVAAEATAASPSAASRWLERLRRLGGRLGTIGPRRAAAFDEGTPLDTLFAEASVNKTG